MTKDEQKNDLGGIYSQEDTALLKTQEEKNDNVVSRELDILEGQDSKAKDNFSAYNIKKIMHDAIASGNLQRALIRLADGMELTKVALKSLSEILEKTKNKLEGNVEEVAGPTGIPIMANMMLPMMLSLLQTQEFQHLIANMFAQLVKDG